MTGINQKFKESYMEKTEQKETDGTIVLSLKSTVEELVNYLGEMEISGACFFIGVDNKTKKLFSSLARVDVPAGTDTKKSVSIQMFDYDYLMAHEEVEMLKYGKTKLYIGHDETDFIIRVGEADETAGGEENV